MPENNITSALSQYRKWVTANPEDRLASRESFYDKFGVDPEEQFGAVAKRARKNLANIQAEKTANEYGEDVRAIWAQGVREIGVPVAVGAVGLATAGAGLPAAMALTGGTAAYGETIAQLGAPTENVARDIALAGGLAGLSEFGGRFIAGAMSKIVAKSAAARAAAKAPDAADYANLAERMGFPLKNVEGKVGAGLQGKVDAARRVAVAKEADEIMKPYGSPISAEIAGQDAGGVFKNIEEHFLGHARDLRKFIADTVGDMDAPLRFTATNVAKLKNELGKRAFRGKEDLDAFFDAMVSDKGAFKRFSVDELLALRTDIGKAMGRMPDSNPQRAFLKRLYGAMSDDAEMALASKDPRLATIFRQANEDFGSYFGALKNEVASRMMNEATAGNGTAVVRELFKADPSDINHVFQFVQKTRPQEMGKFRRTIQQAALQNIFGMADDGAPAMGYKLAERLEKLGPDRLSTIFGGSIESAGALGRVKELAKLTGSFERSLKIPPDMSRQMDAGVKRLVMQAGVALGAKAWGAPYAAARIGADVLRGAGELVMAELAVNQNAFRAFKAGWQKMATSVSSTSMGQAARASLAKTGEAEMKAALGAAASSAAVKVRAESKRAEMEQNKAARRQGGHPQGSPAEVF